MGKENGKTDTTRRQFLETSAKGFTLLGIGGLPSVLKACSQAEEYNLVITGGMIYDGLGNPGFPADIAIKDEKIFRIARRLNTKHASILIDARGMAVSPGFIDAHTHTDAGLLANPRAESHIRQGITTQISGNCGSTYFPVPDVLASDWKKILKEQYDVDLDWQDIGGFFRRLEKTGIALNYSSLIGHGAVRGKVMGLNEKPPSLSQLEEMKQLVRDAMNAGAAGLSTGLEYMPGKYAGKEEIIEICRVVAALGGIYATHMRDEGDKLLEALDEVIMVARESAVSLEISHLKVAYPGNWSMIDAALAKIEDAYREGISISADRYPYIACSTGLALYFPAWAINGSKQECIAKLKNPANQEKLSNHLAWQEKRLGSWEKVLIASVITEKNQVYQGMNILEASHKAGKGVVEFMRDLMIEEEMQVDMISFMMDENNMKRILVHPLTLIGSDSSARAPYGLLGRGNPHPRTYGTFPRVLGRYVREEKILALPEAIAKMTSRTAKKFGILDRGQITENYYADLVVFNPDTVTDNATWKDPHCYPTGIDHVIVNGVPVVSEGEHTGLLPGKVIRK